MLRPSNRKVMRDTGKCIWLQASPEAHYARISGDSDSGTRRPSLTSGGGYAEVVDLLAKREPIYRDLADFSVVTDNRSPDEIVSEIIGWAKESC